MIFSGLSFLFFFKQKTAYEMRISDWSSDVCSSDLSLFLLPFCFLQLFTGAKSFRDNGLLRSKRLNRFGLHSGRARISHELAWWRRRRLAKSISSDDRAQFDGQGYIQVENFLPPDDFLRLRDKIFAHEAPARDMVQGNTVTRRLDRKRVV